MPARSKGQKFCSYPPTIKSKVSRTPNSLSQHPHKAKAYANDPSIISGSLEEHTETVQTINQLSREIDLMICPDKCVTLVWQEENPEKSPDWTPRWLDEINIWKTHRIPRARCNNCNFPSVHSLNTQETTGGEDLPGALKSTDSKPIWGEYTVWIFWNYVVPSSRFLLTADPIYDNGIRSIQSTATKFIKKWLRLPRNATQAILFHPEALNCSHLPNERLKAKVS